MSTDISGMRRVFAVVRLSVYGDTFKIESTKSVPYQTVSHHQLSFASMISQSHNSEDCHKWCTSASPNIFFG